MAGIKDFLAGSGALKKAAQTGETPKPAPAPAPSSNSDLGDVAKRNADYAAKRLASEKQSKSPLATPMGSTKALGKAGKK